MASLTPKQIKEIKDIISKHTNILMQLIIGDAQVSPDLAKKLNLPKSLVSLIDTSYKYGKLRVLKGDISSLSSHELTDMIQNLKVSTRQQKSIDYLKAKSQLAIDTLSAKITANVVNLVLQDHITMYDSIQRVIPDAIRAGTDRYKVVQQLREMTGDWERDWHRVAHTEMWDAGIQGEANAIIDNESPLSQKGKDTIVFKRPAPNACNKCKQLYLEPDGITPRLFKLSEMQALGTNYGLKQADWKPVLGTMHPNCMCTLSVMPDGYHFDKLGQLEMDD